MALLTGTKRVWRDDSEFKGKADAELVQEEINSLAAQDANGKCTNEALVDYARNNTLSEVRKCFEWNDTDAAEKYRLHQAARIKCAILTIAVQQVPGAKKKDPARQIQVITATNHALSTPGQGHKDIVLVTQNQADMAAMDKDMARALRSFAAAFQQRWALAPSYGVIQPIIQDMLSSLSCTGL